MQRRKKWNYKPVRGTFHRCEGCKIFLPCVRRCKYKAKRVPDDKECEMATPRPVKNAAEHPCRGCDHFNRLENYCDFWEVDITDDFKCTNQKTDCPYLPQSKKLRNTQTDLQ